MGKTKKRKNVKFVIYVKLNFLRQLLNKIFEFVDSKQIYVKFVKKKYNK